MVLELERLLIKNIRCSVKTGAGWLANNSQTAQAQNDLPSRTERFPPFGSEEEIYTATGCCGYVCNTVGDGNVEGRDRREEDEDEGRGRARMN